MSDDIRLHEKCGRMTRREPDGSCIPCSSERKAKWKQAKMKQWRANHASSSRGAFAKEVSALSREMASVSVPQANLILSDWIDTKRVLDFDIENRPLSYWYDDRCTAEVTAIAAGFRGEDDITVWLLGRDDPKEMLEGFRAMFDAADIVTGHYIRCMTPETRVLTADLRWVNAGDLICGDRLLSFEATLNGPRRNLEFGTVISNRQDTDDVYAVELATGEVLYATAEHPWLVSTHNAPGARHRWRRTDELLGDYPRNNAGRYGKKPVRLTRAVQPWADDTTFDAGWLGGFYDGEGTIDSRSTGTKSQVTAYQNPGEVLTRVETLLRDKRFSVAISARTPSASALGTNSGFVIRVNGGYSEKLRLLGQIRPVRLLARFQAMPPGQLKSRESVSVVAVTPVGQRTVSRLQTSTHTYIAEGFAVHNSHDLPIVNGAMLEYGLPALGTKMTHDTKLDLVKIGGISASQESLADMLGVRAKKVHMTQQMWRAANRLESITLAEDRVVGDVRQHKSMYDKLLDLGYLRAPRQWSLR